MLTQCCWEHQGLPHIIVQIQPLPKHISSHLLCLIPTSVPNPDSFQALEWSSNIPNEAADITPSTRGEEKSLVFFPHTKAIKSSLHQLHTWVETLRLVKKRFTWAFLEKVAISTFPEANPPACCQQDHLEGALQSKLTKCKIKSVLLNSLKACRVFFFFPGNPLRKQTFETDFCHRMKNMAKNDLTASTSEQHKPSAADLESRQV